MQIKQPRTQHEKDLTKRYLIWCYKTTKEELDRIERYFTQRQVDLFLLKTLRLSPDHKKAKKKEGFRMHVDQFEAYMEKKYRNALKKKFMDPRQKKVHPQYVYLKNRYKAIEKAIVHFFSKKELASIRRMYEEEMSSRIISAREHA